MGKLGARELNYSSDVDLVLLHDPGCRHTSTARRSRGAFFTRARPRAGGADGGARRGRLRVPHRSAAAPRSGGDAARASRCRAAIAYYESMGQNWERAAMLKARPVAGDLRAGRAFLEAIRPFVWRRGLDFAAVADIHAMKRRIDAHKRHRGSARRSADTGGRAIAGHNVKLGEGGIREIEFLAQTLQLVWGGRDPALRVPTHAGGAARCWRGPAIWRGAPAAELAAAYRFLRRVEHRLQMVADRQTHTLPEKPARAGAVRACSWAMPTRRPSPPRCCAI